MDRLAIIACHFNWAHFSTPARNLHRFCRAMERCGVPVCGVEVHLEGIEPETKGYPLWDTHVVSSRAILWQKEALFNAAAAKVPFETEYLVFMDTDCEFTNPDWIKDTMAALEKWPVVQMFESCFWTTRRGRYGRRALSFGSAQNKGCDVRGQGVVTQGFGWAMRNRFFRKIGGWYDTLPTGTGDVAFCIALEGTHRAPHLQEYLLSHIGHFNLNNYQLWADNVWEQVRNEGFGHVQGQVVHEWHGDFKDRQYLERLDMTMGFNASRDLIRRPEGYLEWSGSADPKMVSAIRAYFTNRLED